MEGGMKRRVTSGSAIAFLIACALGRPTAAAPAHGSCADLAAIALPDTKITSADEVRGPSFTPPGSAALNGFEFCRSQASRSPR
jgi:hypothetical protein